MFYATLHFLEVPAPYAYPVDMVNGCLTIQIYEELNKELNGLVSKSYPYLALTPIPNLK